MKRATSVSSPGGAPRGDIDWPALIAFLPFSEYLSLVPFSIFRFFFLGSFLVLF